MAVSEHLKLSSGESDATDDSSSSYATHVASWSGAVVLAINAARLRNWAVSPAGDIAGSHTPAAAPPAAPQSPSARGPSPAPFPVVARRACRGARGAAEAAADGEG